MPFILASSLEPTRQVSPRRIGQNAEHAHEVKIQWLQAHLHSLLSPPHLSSARRLRTQVYHVIVRPSVRYAARSLLPTPILSSGRQRTLA